MVTLTLAVGGAMLLYALAVERLRTAMQMDKEDMQSAGNPGLAVAQAGGCRHGARAPAVTAS